MIVSEEFGKVTNCLWDIPWRPSNVLAYGTPEQREKYLLPVLRGELFDAFAVTEPNAGSDAAACTSTATRTDGGWLINGEKWFVTCGDIAGFLLVQANAGPDALPTIFLVDKASPGRGDDPGAAVHALRGERAPRVHLHRRVRARRGRARRASARATS